MVAAAWTFRAKDITEQEHIWEEYLTIGQLRDKIELAEKTVRDLLTRSYPASDPRSAIKYPAARIGTSRVGAAPMWDPAQADRYLELQAAREKAKAEQRETIMPVISIAEAAEDGLGTIDELVEKLGRPKTAFSRWRRRFPADSEHPFPEAVGVVERVAPQTNMGPPRPLFDIEAARKWIAEYDRREAEVGGGRGRRRRDVAA